MHFWVEGPVHAPQDKDNEMYKAATPWRDPKAQEPHRLWSSIANGLGGVRLP